MHNPFGLLIAAFAAFWMLLCARGMARALRTPDRAKWIMGLMYLLVLVGAGGFFAAALSATGIIKLPPSYEWPAGYVRGVVTTGDGKHIVPLMPSGDSRFTTPNGISYGGGMLTRAAVSSKFSVPLMT